MELSSLFNEEKPRETQRVTVFFGDSAYWVFRAFTQEAFR